MKDGEFKKLKHNCQNYNVFSSGREIEKNYSPDFVLECNRDFIILEHETEPNRKTIIANIFKAAYFLQGNRTGKLIIIMTPKGKSSMISYLKHCVKYFLWLKSKSNLEEVYFIEKSDYYNGEIVLDISDMKLIKKAIPLSSIQI